MRETTQGNLRTALLSLLHAIRLPRRLYGEKCQVLRHAGTEEPITVLFQLMNLLFNNLNLGWHAEILEAFTHRFEPGKVFGRRGKTITQQTFDIAFTVELWIAATVAQR